VIYIILKLRANFFAAFFVERSGIACVYSSLLGALPALESVEVDSFKGVAIFCLMKMPKVTVSNLLHNKQKEGSDTLFEIGRLFL